MATILTIIPYSFYPPISGGAQRCFYILREMARHHTIYVLTSQPETDFQDDEYPHFPNNVNIISTHNGERYKSILNIFPARIADALNSRYLMRSIKEPTNPSLLEVYPTLITLLNKVTFDLFYYESLEALGMIGSLIRRRNINALHLYDAHNCDSDLWMQQASANPGVSKYKLYAAKALFLEKSLYKRVDSFFCCSEIDLKKLEEFNKNRIKGTVIPNGVDISGRPYDKDPEKYKCKNLIFCASLDYFPNKQGLLWFYKDVFPLLKQKINQIRLTIIGNISSNEDYRELIGDTTVNFIGKVDSVVPFYHESSVAIVPLLSGSGTRLKILEAMSLGNPIVTTTVGAEGIDYKNGEHLLVADTAAEFADQVVSILANDLLFQALRLNSFELVKSNYSWSRIGENINNSLSSLFEDHNQFAAKDL